MREWGLSIVEIHGAVDALQGVTFDRFVRRVEGFGHLLEIFSFKFPENEIHLSAFGEVIADAETQTCVFLRAEYLCDVFHPLCPASLPDGLRRNCPKGSARSSTTIKVAQWEFSSRSSNSEQHCPKIHVR